MEAKLKTILPPEAVRTDPAGLEEFSLDGRTPKAAVCPRTPAEAAEVVGLADQEGWAVIPFGGGTSLGLGRRPERFDLAVSTARLDKVIDIDVANLTVTAQAGVRLQDLQDLLTGQENRCFFPLGSGLREKAEYMCSDRGYKGVFLPLDPPLATRASLGGIVAANQTGPRRLAHGLPRDLLLGVRFVAPTGELIGMGGKTVKNVSGYDVGKLLIGSLGSIGLITEMTLRLLPRPERAGAVMAAFPDLARALDFCAVVLGTRLLPTALEVLNAPAAGLAGLEASGAGFAVAVGLAGFEEEVSREIQDLTVLAQASGAAGLNELKAKPAEKMWSDLGDGLCAKPAVRFRAGCRLGGLNELLKEMGKLLHGRPAYLSASAGLGLLRVGLLGQPGLDEAAELGRALRSKAEDLSGALVLESGPPELKDRFDPWGRRRSDFVLMQRLKSELDPRGIMAPGRLLGGL